MKEKAKKSNGAAAKKPDVYTAFLVAYRLNETTKGPDLYGISFVNSRDTPLIDEGRIVLFRSPDQFDQALALAPKEFKGVATDRSDPHVYDFVAAMDVLINEDAAPSGNLLDCVNEILDMVGALECRLPDRHKNVLHGMADHLTFNYEFANFLDEKKISRQSVFDAVYWCVGAIFTHSKIL